MKKVLKLALAFSLMIIAIFAMVACGDDPHYSIYDISYDPEKDVITWSDDSNAEQWIVTINGKKKKVKTTSFKYDSEDKDFDLKIEGLHKKEGKDINPVWSGDVIFMQTPTNLNIADGELRWSSVSGAARYEVYNFGSVMATVSGGAHVALPEGEFDMYVKALGPNEYALYYSYKSESVSGVCLSSPNSITYKDGAFVWEPVTGADFYTVTINGEKLTSNTNKLEYTADGKDIVFTVAASSNKSNTYSAIPKEQTCYYLKPIQNFEFDAQGNLIWDKVVNATEYTITVNDVKQPTELTAEIFTNIQLNKPYKVSVTPSKKGAMYYTDEAITFSFEKLDVVKNVKFSGETSLITWDAHPRAKTYELLVNGETFTTEQTKYALGKLDKDLSIEIRAIGEGENSRSYFAEPAKYTYIAPISNLTIKDGVLTWTPSEKAKNYNLVFTNGQNIVSNECSYSQLQSGTQYTVKVMPRGEGDKCFSYWSENFTFQLLSAPVINYTNGTIKWNGSSATGGYTVKILAPNSTVPFEVELADNVFAYANNYEVAGKYEVSVRANPYPGASNVYASAFSAPISIVRLDATNGHEIISNPENGKDAVQIRFNKVNYAAGYSVYVNNSKVSDANNPEVAVDFLSINTDSDNEQVFKVEVLSTGKINGNEVILDSLNKYTFNVTRLATPQNVTVQGKTVSWSPVNKAEKYIVTVDSKKIIATNTSYELMELTEGEHKVKVQAVSDQFNVIPSKYSIEAKVVKLSAPKNVTLVNNNGTTLLTWGAVENATSYYIRLGTNAPIPWEATAFTIEDNYLNSITEGTGMQLSVYAVCGLEGYIDSEPSETKTISRFERPSALSANASSIKWNDSTVDNIKATSYKLYIRNINTSEPAKALDVNGSSYSIADLEPGSYEVYVVALGDNAKTLTSPESDRITVKKLDSVNEVRIGDDKKSYVWDAVEGAQKYKVTVDGIEYIATSPSFKPTFTVASNHTITITPISDQQNCIAGKAYTFNQLVSALTTPTYVQDGELGDHGFKIEQNGANYTITASQIDKVAVEYKYVIAGSTKGPSANNTYSGILPTANWDHDVQVQFIADSFGTDGVYYVSSAMSQIVKIRFSN